MMITALRRTIDRLNKVSLRAKLTFGFLVVLSSTVIVGTTSLFTEKRDAAAIKRLLDIETRIADISRNCEDAPPRRKSYALSAMGPSKRD